MAVRAKYSLPTLLDTLQELELIADPTAQRIMETYLNDIEQAKIDGRNEVCDRIEKSMNVMKGERACKSPGVL
ncbi:hypothetical protein vBRpoSV10_147 [Ruegeria phage vB_RpoS-V10]|nr:hypothetical protein vBRpoSV10_147 [Ruegeria phage vB_RpoS-V10]